MFPLFNSGKPVCQSRLSVRKRRMVIRQPTKGTGRVVASRLGPPYYGLCSHRDHDTQCDSDDDRWEAGRNDADERAGRYIAGTRRCVLAITPPCEQERDDARDDEPEEPLLSLCHMGTVTRPLDFPQRGPTPVLPGSTGRELRLHGIVGISQ